MTNVPYIAIVTALKKKNPVPGLNLGDRVTVVREGKNRFGRNYVQFLHNGEKLFGNPSDFEKAKPTAAEKKTLDEASAASEADYVTVNASFERLSDSGKAGLLNFSGLKKWVPLSAMKREGDVVKVASWFAIKNGLDEYKAEPVNPTALIAALKNEVETDPASADEKKKKILELLTQLVNS
jgi:hypothetical protein